MLVSKKAKTMPPCKDTALFVTMQYGVHRILTKQLIKKVYVSFVSLYDFGP